MAEIIPIDKKRLLSDKEKAARIRKQKIQAVRRVFQCTHCRIKCEKCGTQIDGKQFKNDGVINKLRVPYRFCQSCSEEYVDYVERLKGQGDSDCYWHNEALMNSWRAWIDYRGALDQHTKSKEFLQLLRDLED